MQVFSRWVPTQAVFLIVFCVITVMGLLVIDIASGPNGISAINLSAVISDGSLVIEIAGLGLGAVKPIIIYSLVAVIIWPIIALVITAIIVRRLSHTHSIDGPAGAGDWSHLADMNDPHEFDLPNEAVFHDDIGSDEAQGKIAAAFEAGAEDEVTADIIHRYEAVLMGTKSARGSKHNPTGTILSASDRLMRFTAIVEQVKRHAGDGDEDLPIKLIEEAAAINDILSPEEKEFIISELGVIGERALGSLSAIVGQSDEDVELSAPVIELEDADNQSEEDLIGADLALPGDEVADEVAPEEAEIAPDISEEPLTDLGDGIEVPEERDVALDAAEEEKTEDDQAPVSTFSETGQSSKLIEELIDLQDDLVSAHEEDEYELYDNTFRRMIEVSELITSSTEDLVSITANEKWWLDIGAEIITHYYGNSAKEDQFVNMIGDLIASDGWSDFDIDKYK